MEIKILTWNIALNQFSAATPKQYLQDFGLMGNTFEITRIIENENPDIFSLQEMPYPKFAKRFINFQCTEPILTHSGYLSIFYSDRFELFESLPQGPAIKCKFIDQQNRNKPLVVVACHLLPYKKNSAQRFQELERIVAGFSYDKSPTVIIGDMNLREYETNTILDEFNLKDAFLEIGESSNKFSWDSFQNHFHPDGFEFKARFDRIFLDKFNPVSFRLVANDPLSENPHHFASDHFALVCEIIYFDELS